MPPSEGGPLVVHPHLHPRRTGVTRHVEAVVRALAATSPVRAFGAALSEDVPRVTFRELLRRARSSGVVWHAHRNNEALLGLLLRAVFRRTRVLFTRHAATPPGAWTRFLYRRVDQPVALTAEGARAIGPRARVVPHGVDLTRFHPPQDRDRAWAALGLGGRFGVGVVGRIRPGKGQGDFVDAVAPLLPEAQDWTPVLVGRVKPSDRAFARGLVERTGGRLVLAGEREDVAAFYRGLTVVVQPSRSEGFSLVLLEAMAAGCCVVAARLPHFPEWIEDGVTGLLYPPGDTATLSEMLRNLLLDPTRAQEVGRAAAAAAKIRFGIEQEARALSALYQPGGG